jgi:hypothetical protein
VKVKESKLVEYVRLVEVETDNDIYDVEFMLDKHTYDWRVWHKASGRELNTDEIMEAFTARTDDILQEIMIDIDNEGYELERASK